MCVWEQRSPEGRSISCLEPVWHSSLLHLCAVQSSARVGSIFRSVAPSLTQLSFRPARLGATGPHCRRVDKSLRHLCTMSAARTLSPGTLRLLKRGRTELLAARGAADVPGLRSLTCPPLSTSSLGRALSSLSATRRRVPKEKMSENGVSSRAKVLTIDTMNPTVKKVEYAVRGPIVQRAVELERELSQVCMHFSPFGLFGACVMHVINPQTMFRKLSGCAKKNAFLQSSTPSLSSILF